MNLWISSLQRAILFLKLFKYSCLHFPPTTLPHASHPHLPLLIPPPLGFVHVSFIVFPENPSPISPSPLWSLSVCSLFPCLWFYFACLFVLLIRFHLKVRSHGICLSPPGLFHLAQCSPVPSTLLRRVGALGRLVDRALKWHRKDMQSSLCLLFTIRLATPSGALFPPLT